MLKNLELAVGTDTYIPEVEGIVPFHNCDSDEDIKELDAIIVTIDNDVNTIQELKAFQKTLPVYGINQQTYEWFLQNIHSKIQFPFELPAVESISSTGKNKVLAKQLYYAIEEMNQSLLQKMKTKIVEWWKKFIAFVQNCIRKLKYLISSSEFVKKCKLMSQQKIPGIEEYFANSVLPYKIPSIKTFQFSIDTTKQNLNNILEIFIKNSPINAIFEFHRKIDYNTSLSELRKVEDLLDKNVESLTVENLWKNTQHDYLVLWDDYIKNINKQYSQLANLFYKIDIDSIIKSVQDENDASAFYHNVHGNMTMLVNAVSRTDNKIGKYFNLIILNINDYIKNNPKK